ncbi:hypothetical protein F5X68DRAFT_186904 [Plectosphaerella plurivora]|uniref:Uncharacterized protein n=1 Tax=Plectosphaerella plurivora TaxID=936078 RepID=A0A9P8VKR0_9PEZI|nr:hypothetical protein F5X68DRAFT_186904 [Plectosphaerella plurivora]
MSNGIDYAMTSVARDIVEPMVEEAVAHYKMLAPPYDVSDVKREMTDVNDDESDSGSDGHSDSSLGKRSRSSSDESDSDNESKHVKFDSGMDTDTDEDKERAYLDLLLKLDQLEKELNDKDAAIAEKDKLLEEAQILFQNKHEELCMSRQEVERLELEHEAKQAEMEAAQRRMIDAEAALQIQLSQQAQAPGGLTQSLQAGANDSQLLAEIQTLTAHRDEAFRFAGQAQMEAANARNQLNQTVQETNLQMSQLQRDIQNLTAERDQANTQLAETTSRLNDLNSERDGLLARQADDFLAIDALKQLLESQESAAPTYSFDIAPKVTDDEVRSLWQGLYSEVVVLCSVLKRKPEMSELSKKHHEIFTSMMPEKTSVSWDKYLEDDKHRKFLVEAFVWENIVRYLDDNKVWLGKIGTDFKTTLKHMRDGLDNQTPFDWNNLKKYCVWRAQGAHKLSQFGAHDDMRAQLVATVPFMELLRPFCSVEPWVGQSGIEFKEIFDSVYSILSTCQKLDHVFMTSLANWRAKLNREHKSWAISFHNHPEWFGNVKPIAGKPTFPIAFQISPYLFRMGTADGEDHETMEFIAKGSVMPSVKF